MPTRQRITEVVADEWREVFASASPDDDFFALGGDSLMAIQVASGIAVALELGPEWDARIIEILFVNPSLSRLVTALAEAVDDGRSA